MEQAVDRAVEVASPEVVVFMRSSLLLALAFVALFATGCGGYYSEYTPPDDGRPRLVWRDDGPVKEMANGIRSGCARATDDALASAYDDSQGAPGSPRASGVTIVPSPGAIWMPVPVVHVGSSGHGGAPMRVAATPHVGGSGGGSSHGGHSSGGGHAGSGGGSSGGVSSGGGGGGGNNLGEGIAYVAIIGAAVAIVALPFVTLSLAVSRPEPELQTAMEIDSFNAHTDLARVPASPCDETVAGEGAE